MVGVSKEGRGTSMLYAVADINVALDSVSQMCDKGATVIFQKHGGRVIDGKGTEHTFDRVGNTYKRRMWIPRAEGFTGLRQTS